LVAVLDLHGDWKTVALYHPNVVADRNTKRILGGDWKSLGFAVNLDRSVFLLNLIVIE
jgi:hypothetical protein